jgi:hypothetical protein
VTRPSDSTSFSSVDSSKKKKKKTKKNKNDGEGQESWKREDLTSTIRKKIDRALNSPSMTKDLLKTSPDLKRETEGGEPEVSLRLG